MTFFVDAVWSHFPKTIEAFDDKFFDYVRDLQVDNLGAYAGRLLLQKMGAKHAPDGFRARAVQMIEAYRVEDPRERTDERKFGGPSRHKHVFSYAEYRIHGACLKVAQPFEGAIIQENGARSEHLCESPFFAIRLPINDRVDRTACSEYLLLADFCWMLRVEGASEIADRHGLQGTLRIFSTGPSCLSCLIAMWQFRMRYPQITLEIDYVKMQALPMIELRRPPSVSSAASELKNG